MAFTVTSLPNYTEQNRSALISASVLAAKSTRLFTPMPDVKGATTLNLLDVGITFQDGASCGFEAAGNDTISQRTLTPGIVKINKSWCPKVLRTKYTVHELEIGAGRETLPFEEKLMADIIAKVGAENEKAMWQGDTVNGSGNLALYNGLATIINTDVTNSVITNTTTAANTDTIYDRVYAVYRLIPDEALADAAIFMSYALFRELVLQLMALNLFHYERSVDETMEFILPGTNTRVIGVPGMVGLNRIYAFEPEQVVYGFDAADDIETFRLWYSEDNDEFRVRLQYAAGVQYAFPSRMTVGIPYGGGN